MPCPTKTTLTKTTVSSAHLTSAYFSGPACSIFPRKERGAGMRALPHQQSCHSFTRRHQSSFHQHPRRAARPRRNCPFRNRPILPRSDGGMGRNPYDPPTRAVPQNGGEKRHRGQRGPLPGTCWTNRTGSPLTALDHLSAATDNQRPFPKPPHKGGRGTTGTCRN